MRRASLDSAVQSPRSSVADPDGLAIRVLIAEDHPTSAAGLRSELERDSQGRPIIVVDTVYNGEHACAYVREYDGDKNLRPDVVVMDVRMPPGKGGLSACLAINQFNELKREQDPSRRGQRVLIWSAYPDPTYVAAVIEAHAAGFVLKTQPASVVAEAVRFLVEDEAIEKQLTYIRPRFPFQQATQPMLSLAERSDVLLRGLNHTEKLVLEAHVLQGLSGREVETKLSMTSSMVGKSKTSAYRKLGLENCPDKIRMARAAYMLGLSDGAAGRTDQSAPS